MRVLKLNALLLMLLGWGAMPELRAQEPLDLSDSSAAALFEDMPLVLTASRMAQSALDALETGLTGYTYLEETLHGA